MCAYAATLAAALPVPGEAATSPVAPVRLDFFFEPGCDECARVRDDVLPGIEARYAGLYALAEWDLSRDENHRRLVAAMEALGSTQNARVYILVDGRELLGGVEAISARLGGAIDERVAALADAAAPVAPAALPAPASGDAMAGFAGRFTLAGVMAAGLADGINPCAFSTLVFLMSVLSMARVTGGALLAVGATFCVASFLTYMGIGLGLLSALRWLATVPGLRAGIDAAMIALLLVLAAVSLADAFRFRRTQRAGDVRVQLPAGLKNRVHRLLRLGIGRRARLVSAFAVGVAVTGLESVCTGQVYVPTLAYLARTQAAGSGRWLAYLAAYNAMFILPLVAILVLTHQGLKLQRLMAWSAREVFVGKLAMAAVFLGLAAAIAAL